jgi:hypothetical protein
MEMPRRIEMGSVVGGQRDVLDRRKPHPARNLSRIDAGEKVAKLAHRLAMFHIFNLRSHERRIRDHVVFEQDRQVDEVARHGSGICRLKQPRIGRGERHRLQPPDADTQLIHHQRRGRMHLGFPGRIVHIFQVCRIFDCKAVGCDKITEGIVPSCVPRLP